ncbi:hypothetical protein WA026_019354 [Henosepilachna vigintioctopunctata]|uniref:Ankyrin repeat protein n=1 Tax=Henosepilachna vigintioctopunctata TaxID=420089 RepID=A0AAW1UEH4_9CUCU
MPKSKPRRYMVLQDEESRRKMLKSSDNEFGHTPLHFACFNGNYSRIESILSQKPNLNIKNLRGFTPLMEFVNRPPENEVILTKLLEAGANPNIPDKEGNSPLHTLAFTMKTNKTKIFASILVKYKANVNSQNNYKHTALHWAIFRGNEYLVEGLLQCGASINIPNASGGTPMDAAFENRFRNPKIFTLLSEQLIVQYCCGFSVNLDYLEEVCRDEIISDFKKGCEEEIRQLKVTLAGDSTVTYYDLLVCSTPVVARYLSNTSILASLSEFDFKQSRFGYILKIKFKTASQHLHGIKIGIAAAAKIFPFLPHICIEKLIEYFNIDDCINLDKACSFRTQILE